MPARRRSLLSAALPALAALLGWARPGGAGIEYPVEPPMTPEAFAAAICLHGPGSETVLAGTVSDAEGRPLPGVAVTAAGLPPALPQGPACEARGETGADGGFRLAVRRLPVTYEILAVRDGFAPAIATAPGDEPAGGLGPLRITLSRGRDAAGRVTDGGGRPIAGAHVSVRRIRSIGGASGGLGRLGTSGFPDDRLYSARSGADGHFTLAHLPLDGRLELDLRAPGIALPMTGKAIALAAAGDRGILAPPADLGTFVLPAGGELAGRVADPEGRPIAGAAVWLSAAKNLPTEEDNAAFESAGPAATTAADGRFAVRGVGGLRAVSVCAPGHLPAWFLAEETPEPLEIELRPAASLAGRVVDEAGRPVAGAAVAYEPAWTGPAEVEPPAGPCGGPSRVTTDADGRFAFPLVPPGRARLRAEAKGFLRTAWQPVVSATAAAGAPGAPVELRLSRGALLAGRVSTDAGLPSPGALVQVDGERSEGAAASDAQGLVEAAVEPGMHRVSVLAEGRDLTEGARLAAAVPGPRLEVQVPSPSAADRPTAGRVTGPRGEPVAGARVRYVWGVTLTRADGRFALPGGGAHGPFEVSAEGYAVASGPGPEIRLAPEHAIEGRLVGLAPADALAVDVSAQGFPTSVDGTVDARGRYRIGGLAPGSWKIYVLAGGGRRWLPATVEVTPGAKVVRRDLVFPPWKTVELRGRTLAPDGSPVAGARVEIGPEDGSSLVGNLPFFALSDARGGFVAHVPPGSYALAARRGGLAARLPLTVRAGAAQKPLAVRLAPPAGAVLTGRVAGLAPGEVAAVGVTRLAHYPAQTGEDGRYSIVGVPPGRHVVEVRIGSPAGWPLWAEVEIPAGAREATLDFTYPPRDRSLAVQILGYDHLAELDVSLTAAWPELSIGLSKNRAFDRTTVPDAQGRVRFECLPAGRYAVEVVHATTGRSLAQREIVLPMDGELSLDLHRSTD